MSDSGILETKTVHKVWGRQDLPAPFNSEARADGADPVGEIWFQSPPDLSDILVKYLFTSQKLSVQVHPSDAQARDEEEGKEECWLILDAQPGAQLAIGFREELSPDEMRASALDGSIERLLDWREVKAGDFFYLPAGTVHAIGPGLSLVEVQQSSDTTFRLFDYGRPRQLHLDRAIDVAHGGQYSEDNWTHVNVETQVLVHGPYFRLVRMIGQPTPEMLKTHAQPVMVLPLEGEVSLDRVAVDAGHCAHASSLDRFAFSENALTLLVASAR